MISYCKSTTLLMITNLGNHQMILSMLWLKAYSVVADFATKILLFKPHHCTHTKALLNWTEISLMFWTQLLLTSPLSSSLRSVVISVIMTIFKWSELWQTTEIWLSMSKEELLSTTSVTSKKTRTLPLKENLIDIKRVEAADIIFQ